MKKKIFILLSIVGIIILTSAVTFAVNNSLINQKHTPSDYKVGISFDDAMKSQKPIVTLFYVDWCGYCMKFMPRFKTLESLYKSKYDFLMVNVEDATKADFVKDYGITGFPTVYIIDPKYKNRVHLSNSIYMDLPKFREELDRYKRIRIQLDQAEGCAN